MLNSASPESHSLPVDNSDRGELPQPWTAQWIKENFTNQAWNSAVVETSKALHVGDFQPQKVMEAKFLSQEYVVQSVASVAGVVPYAVASGLLAMAGRAGVVRLGLEATSLGRLAGDAQAAQMTAAALMDFSKNPDSNRHYTFWRNMEARGAAALGTSASFAIFGAKVPKIAEISALTNTTFKAAIEKPIATGLRTAGLGIAGGAIGSSVTQALSPEHSWSLEQTAKAAGASVFAPAVIHLSTRAFTFANSLAQANGQQTAAGFEEAQIASPSPQAVPRVVHPDDTHIQGQTLHPSAMHVQDPPAGPAEPQESFPGTIHFSQGEDVSEAHYNAGFVELTLDQEAAHGDYTSVKNIRATNFDGASLAHANFRGLDLRGIDFSRARSVSYTDFSNTDLTGANFEGCDLTGANFSGAKNIAAANFDRADLHGVNFGHTDLTGGDFSKAKNLMSAVFDGADLNQASFKNRYLVMASFKGAKNIKFANFAGADMGDVDFSDTDLRGADLSTAMTLSSVNFSQADLDGTNLSGQDLVGAAFINALNFSKADIKNAIIRLAELRDCDLTGVDFSKAFIFRDNSFARSDLRGTNFSGHSLAGSDFTGAINFNLATLDAYNMRTLTAKAAIQFFGGPMTEAWRQHDSLPAFVNEPEKHSYLRTVLEQYEFLDPHITEDIAWKSVRLPEAAWNLPPDKFFKQLYWSYSDSMPTKILAKLEETQPPLQPWERLAANMALEFDSSRYSREPWSKNQNKELVWREFEELRAAGREATLSLYANRMQIVDAYHPQANIATAAAISNAVTASITEGSDSIARSGTPFDAIKYLKLNEFERQLKYHYGAENIEASIEGAPEYALKLVSNFGDASSQYLNKLLPLHVADMKEITIEAAVQNRSEVEAEQIASLFRRLDKKPDYTAVKAAKSREEREIKQAEAMKKWQEDRTKTIQEGLAMPTGASGGSGGLLEQYARLSEDPPRLAQDEIARHFHESTHFLPLSRPEAKQMNSFAKWMMDNVIYQKTEPLRDADGKAIWDLDHKQQFTSAMELRPARELQVIGANWHLLSEQERTLKYSQLLALVKSRKYSSQINEGFAAQAANAGITEENYRDLQTGFLASSRIPSPFPLDKSWTSIDQQLTGRFIDRTDPRGLFLGILTDCCQHPNGPGAPAAHFGQTAPGGGFFVVSDGAGNVVAQSMAWVSDKGGLVFDSIEGKGLAARALAVSQVYNAASSDLQEHFNTITVGADINAGNTDLINGFWPPASEGQRQPLPAGLDYSDAKNKQLLLAQNTKAAPPVVTSKFVRRALAEDRTALDKIVKESYSDGKHEVIDEPGNLVLQVDGQAVGYAAVDYMKREIADFAVLRDYRNRSQLLGRTLMHIVEQRGGEWTGSFEGGTSYKLLQYLAGHGKVKVIEDNVEHGAKPGEDIHQVKFVPVASYAPLNKTTDINSEGYE